MSGSHDKDETLDTASRRKMLHLAAGGGAALIALLSGSPAIGQAVGHTIKQPSSRSCRRVVAGTDAAGHSVIVSDGPPEEFHPSLSYKSIVDIWAFDERPHLPHGGANDVGINPVRKDQSWVFPGRDGLRVMIITMMSPEEQARAAKDIDFSRVGTTPFGERLHLVDARTGMHWTESIDILCVLEGETQLILEDGVTTTLKTGDWFVSNGVKHTWRHGQNVKLLAIVAGTTGVTA